MERFSAAMPWLLRTLSPKGKSISCPSWRFAAISAHDIKPFHIPVMLDETLDYLNIKPKSTVVDMTFGSGGHTKEILLRHKDCHVIALDRDEAAFGIAKNMASQYEGRLTPLLGKFSELDGLLQKLGYNDGSIDGVLIDCGGSSMQFDNAERGFSVSKDGPLDMRMDGARCSDQLTAADVVNHLSEDDIARIILQYGEENKAKQIARVIMENRPFYRTKQLATAVGNALSPFDHSTRSDSLGRRRHVATKTFMALRIFVNDEMNELHAALSCGEKYLCNGGRLVSLTFHSLEHKVFKHFFRKRSQILKDGKADERTDIAQWKVEKDLLSATTEKEIAFNPRSRSALLRVATRVRGTYHWRHITRSNLVI